MVDPVPLQPDRRAWRAAVAPAVVHAVWVAMSTMAFAFVWKYGRNVPFMEDWDLVPTLSGAVPFRFSWLFEQTVEHRYILARALLYPLWQLTYDGRSAMWLSTALLSATAFSLLRTARRVRGRASVADAFFPLVLLHPGHAETLIFFLQLCYVLPVVILGAATVLIATDRWAGRPVWTAILAALVALLPLNGAIGLLMAVPLVAWMAWVSFARRSSRALGASAVAATALEAVYFIGYQAPPLPALVARTVRGTARTTVEILSVGFGPGAAWWWPWSGIVAGAALGLAAGALAFQMWREPGDRTRAGGVLACVAATGILVAGIAWGRTRLGPGAGIPPRYALLVASGLCAAFLASALVGRTLLATRIPQYVLAACAAAALWSNVEVGREYGRPRLAASDAVLADVRAGVPTPIVAARAAAAIYPNPGALAVRLDMLRAQGSGPYHGVAAPAPRACAGEAAVTARTLLNEATMEGDVLRCTGPDGFAVYALAAPTDVCSVTVDVAYELPATGEVPLQLYWCLEGSSGFEEARRMQTAVVDTAGGRQSVTFDVYDRIDRIRIDPAPYPCAMRIERIRITTRDAASPPG